MDYERIKIELNEIQCKMKHLRFLHNKRIKNLFISNTEFNRIIMDIKRFKKEALEYAYYPNFDCIGCIHSEYDCYICQK